ncbi:MAG TPA: polyprenol monophosphomannose synthase [Solirubrobacteraceae bacterium]
MTSRVWLTIPTFDEAGNVERIVRAAAAELERLLPGEYRVLVVDDCSPDGTGEIAERLAAELGVVEVLHRKGKDGLGQAYRAGFARAVAGGAELVLVMDADFSHDPAHLPSLIEAAEDADLVLGSRYVPGGRIVDWPPLRRLLSRWGGIYARRVLGVGVRDLTGGYRCIRREVLETINASTLRSQGYVFNIEFAYRALLAGFRVREVPITFADRRVGQSKMAFRIALEALWLLPRLPERARRLGPRVGAARPVGGERAARTPARSASTEST